MTPRSIARLFLIAGLFAALSTTARADDRPAPMVEKFLIEGKLDPGEKALQEQLKAKPDDDQARFGLGVLQFIRGVDRFIGTAQGLGLRDQSMLMGFLNIPSGGATSQPATAKAVSVEDLRKLLEQWLADMTLAEKTLSQIKSKDVTLPLHFALIRLDTSGDRTSSDDEAIYKIFERVSRSTIDVKDAESFVIGFDRADAEWLRGYCHLMSGLTEFFLAYDWTDWFNCAGHLIFERTNSPYKFLRSRSPSNGQMSQFDYIADVIAFIHQIHWPLKEPERMKKALEHLQAMIDCSRRTWDFVLAETDDFQEWIPNPKQTSVMPGGQVTEDIVRGWKMLLAEAEAILSGKTLIPFWRGTDLEGVNLKRVFTEPRDFDLVLWVQGSAAAPYLEKGNISSSQTWETFMRMFGGNFIGFAIWFN